MEGCNGIGKNWAAGQKKCMGELNMQASLEHVANVQVDLVGRKSGGSRFRGFGSGGMSTALAKEIRVVDVWPMASSSSCDSSRSLFFFKLRDTFYCPLLHR